MVESETSSLKKRGQEWDVAYDSAIANIDAVMEKV